MLCNKSDVKFPTTHCNIPKDQCWNPDPEIRFSIKVHNSALYLSTLPDLWIRICHCERPYSMLY